MPNKYICCFAYSHNIYDKFSQKKNLYFYSFIFCVVSNKIKFKKIFKRIFYFIKKKKFFEHFELHLLKLQADYI